ncbi:MAG: hypothetical protein AB1846_20120 [Chloroflexota bacterium]
MRAIRAPATAQPRDDATIRPSVHMTNTRTVILYGNSLAVSSIGAILRARPGLRLLPLDAALPGAAEQLEALRPDVILFDLAAVPPEFPVSLLREQPELLLIGLDAARDKLLLFSSRPARSLTNDQLVQEIERQPARPTAS